MAEGTSLRSARLSLLRKADNPLKNRAVRPRWFCQETCGEGKRLRLKGSDLMRVEKQLTLRNQKAQDEKAQEEGQDEDLSDD